MLPATVSGTIVAVVVVVVGVTVVVLADALYFAKSVVLVRCCVGLSIGGNSSFLLQRGEEKKENMYRLKRHIVPFVGSR